MYTDVINVRRKVPVINEKFCIYSLLKILQSGFPILLFNPSLTIVLHV